MKKTGNLFAHILAALFCQLLLLPSISHTAQTVLTQEAPTPAINVAAVVRPRHIQFDEKARLDLTLSGDASITQIEAPRFNFLPAFLAVPLSSETTPHLSNNAIQVSIAWAYELIPQAIGDFTLSDVRFAYQGTPYFANPGSIRVSGSDTYRDPDTNAVHQIEATVESTTSYLNAPLTYTFRYLYTTVLPTREAPTPVLPDFPGFRVETRPAPASQTEQIRGKTFWVEREVRLLYPKKSGQLVIEPAALVLPFRSGAKRLITEPIKLTVRPLPETGKPADFSGAVGEYSISAQVSRTTIEAGQALTLRLRISGRGNIATVTPPKLPKIRGLVVSTPTAPETSESTTTARVYTYRGVATQSGSLRVPAIPYSYFNPSLARYDTAYTASIPLAVRPKPQAPVDTDAARSTTNLWLIAVAGVLALLFGVIGYLWYRSGFKMPARLQTFATDKTESPDAETPATAAFSALTALANSDAEEKDALPFANGLAETLYEYLEATFDLPKRSIEAARSVCTDAEVPETVLQELIALFMQCDYHRFAPVPLIAAERKTLAKRAESVITALEKLQP